MTSHYVLTQIINGPTDILEDASSCIDLIFKSQSNMVLNSGIHSSFHSNSHHQVVFAKFDLKVYYPSPCERHVWHYKYANTAQIKNALASFNWEQALSNSSIDKKIYILNETIINVISNYIPNEIKVFDDQKPPWMNTEIENLITANDVLKKHLKNNRNHYHTYKYKGLQWKLENLIESSKQSFYKRISGKLSSSSTSSKCYWSLLKRMLNGKKIPVILPLLHNNSFISNFKEKSKLFNEHFSEQCSLLQNKSAIPLVFIPLTHNLFSSFQFTADDIKSIRNKLHPNKVHGHDMISIRMIKLCGDSIYRPL